MIHRHIGQDAMAQVEDMPGALAVARENPQRFQQAWSRRSGDVHLKDGPTGTTWTTV